jgi:hypothetical protein
MPFPIEETTPPVTKTYFGTGILFYPLSAALNQAHSTLAAAAAPRGSSRTSLVSSTVGELVICSLG